MNFLAAPRVTASNFVICAAVALSDLQGFAFGGQLRDQADGLRARRIDAAAGEEQVANERVAEIAL